MKPAIQNLINFSVGVKSKIEVFTALFLILAIGLLKIYCPTFPTTFFVHQD